MVTVVTVTEYTRDTLRRDLRKALEHPLDLWSLTTARTERKKAAEPNAFYVQVLQIHMLHMFFTPFNPT